jgi:signal transduction histidine kinase/CheY-like chemotaxis protein
VGGALVYEPDTSEIAAELPRRMASAGLRSLVAAPLLVENQVFGVLLAARTDRDSFSSADCEFLRQLSEHVALAAHQVDLYTALQKAYDDLRESQQTILQQERLRALGQMASGIAHDINNAISPVSLYTEALLENEPGLSEHGRESLHIIQRAIGDVGQTVARMREFYRQQDRQEQLGAVDLNVLVEQVLALTSARWSDVPQERGIVIDVRTALEAELPKVRGTQSDIRDALTNLVFNAVDAMPDGGVLTLRTRRVALSGLDAAERPVAVELSVTDTGVGMDDETRRRCFEPFFTTKGERGTGMGLAMVYGMVKRQGAEIDVESAPGKGTTVRVRFAAAPESVAAPSQPVEPLPARALRLLVIDDDPLVGQSLHYVLQNEGHSVAVADAGQAGIEAFTAAHQGAEPFDLVMTDLGMPYVDGRAVAAAVKALSPRTPVVLLTGWGQRLSTEQSIPANVDRLLSKPPKLPDLRRTLAELMAQREEA